MDLDPINVAKLDVASELPDLRRDIHVFVDYVRSREVKRSHRDNTLGKADARRLAKLMSDPEAAEEVEEVGGARWINFVDDLALRLGFVRYDTTGEYAGYTSQSPSFPDNYIEFQEDPYQQFVAAKAAKQEAMLLELLLRCGQGGGSEFFSSGVLGRLDRFNFWGSAIGVVPTLDFVAIRRFLLGLLAECPAGEWLSTASLIAELKKSHPYFLIPKNPQVKDAWARGQRVNRYDNFHESKQVWGHEIDIHDGDVDAFERVEGRYVERFLEGFPLTLGYVDVAYARQFPKGLYPLLGCLKGFRVHPRLRLALDGKIPEPRVIVTPNFDVHVQADFYPAGVLARLAPLCESVSEGTSFVLKLTKQRVAAARAADPKLDAAALLQTLSAAALPANVARELSAWSEHGEKFVVHPDCCLLESDADLAAADPFTILRLAPGIRIVRSPDKLFDKLERAELAPLRFNHDSQAFSPLPEGARTVFPKASAARKKARPSKSRVTLSRVTRVQLVCVDRAFFDRLQGLLAEQKCPVEVDRKNLTLAYSKQREAEVSNALKQLNAEYAIEITDLA